MDIIYLIFGEGRDLNIWQMGSRAVVVFFITVLLIRIAGMLPMWRPNALKRQQRHHDRRLLKDRG